MNRLGMLVASSVSLFAVACGGGSAQVEVKTPQGAVGVKPVVSQVAQDKFNQALDSFNANDKASSWSDASCAEVARMFEAATAEAQGGKFPEATYDAGLAWQRCGNDQQARAHFEKALSDDPKFHYAKAQIALYDYKANGNENQAIAALQQAVLDAQFQDVPALVNLALFQMQRDSGASGQSCSDDLDCAKKNLQRALAIDDAYMPAFNQLALYYFQLAKKRATVGGGKREHGRGGIATNSAMAKRGDVQQLELAALVCSQALKKNPNYAPIHNTAGLIQNELGQVNGAVGEFATAARLDPKFFEAQMNFAAVNLSFRGFAQAQDAYQKALAMRPNDYDAHLGLALALRGQINDSNYDSQVAAVQAELDAAKKIDANRPDAYFNEGILTQEYKAKAGGAKPQTIAALEQARTIFRTFLDKAGGKAEYAGAVSKANERLRDIDDTIKFLS